MNISPASSPPLSCRLVRGWIALFGNETSAQRNSHVCRCPGCQAYFAAADDFDRMLRRDAAAARAEPPSSLEANILRAVRQSTPPRRHYSLLPILSLSGVAAAIAAGVVMLESSPAPPSATVIGDDTAAVDSSPAAARPAVVTDMPDLLAQLRPQAEAVMRQQPLQNELDAVVSSARGAVRFLAKNFMPADAVPAGVSGRG
jgi:hypothetical protein